MQNMIDYIQGFPLIALFCIKPPHDISSMHALSRQIMQIGFA